MDNKNGSNVLFAILKKNEDLIHSSLENGSSFKDISAILNRKGILISAPTIRYWFRINIENKRINFLEIEKRAELEKKLQLRRENELAWKRKLEETREVKKKLELEKKMRLDKIKQRKENSELKGKNKLAKKRKQQKDTSREEKYTKKNKVSTIFMSEKIKKLAEIEGYDIF